MKQLSKNKLREIRGGGNTLSNSIQADRLNGLFTGWENGNSGNVAFVRENLGGPGNGVGAWVSGTAQS